MIRTRTAGNKAPLGVYSTADGGLTGGALTPLWRPAKNRTKAIFLSCLAMRFLVDFPLAFGRNLPVCAVSALGGEVRPPICRASRTRRRYSIAPLR